MDSSTFSQRLLAWRKTNPRPLPWKAHPDAYTIWLSEIILQQTRVEQGLPYFERFREKYPTVEALANAPEDEVMKLWEGLGYYSRARNLHGTAKMVASELGGQFPDTYEGLLQLKGVGAYTAAAIASFAYDLPHAVLDGNVFRVLARYLGIDLPIDSTEGKKLFARRAGELLDAANPAEYNQAIMDFGATWCTPRNPQCSACPMSQDCRAFQQNRVEQLPVKAKKIEKRDRFFHYLVLRTDGQTLIRKRTDADIWQQLYEFPVIEREALAESPESLMQEALWQELIGEKSWSLRQIAGPFRQLLTHQKVVALFFEIDLEMKQLPNTAPFIAVEQKNLNNFAFPKVIDRYLKDNSLYLRLV
ncbi:MAG: A/G-specific adenine glycosylase [Saprospiraceae bacterium]|nr:A/G-specific adenine glycosylase [Saprospiraceae bacterium]